MKQQRLVQRQHPLFSPVALLATAVLILILLLALWRTGGRAFAPGDLSAVARSPQQSGGFASHAAFADACTQCHEPWVGVTAVRCQACHTLISEQRAAAAGLHGRLATDDCTRCHSEHQGRDHDLFSAAFDQFTTDHHDALFPLQGAHAALDCAGCHANAQYAGTPEQCQDCHAEPALHHGLLGIDCVRCHTPTAWRPAQLTLHTFPLDHGDAGQIACAVCHASTFVSYRCDHCHDPAEMVASHQKEEITPAELNNCIACHATGLKEDEM